MLKDKLNYKLINCALIMVIIFLLYQTGGLWSGILRKLWNVTSPFIIAFALAYALHPLVKFLTDHKIPKIFAILITLIIILGVFIIFGIIVVPLLFNQLGSLFNGIMTFINELSTDYNVNFNSLKNTLSTAFDQIITGLSKYVSDGAMNAISISISLISKLFIIFSAAMYILSDMDKIREGIKNYFYKKSKKVYKYICLLDTEMRNYITGFVRIMIISLFEYTLAYAIIGHPNAILLGCLAMIANLIPYFGGMINNVIAAVTAFVISPALFVKTLIIFVVLSLLDGYVINPLVYGKTNKVHPLVVIMSVFVGGALFGVVGIVISLPLAIIVITTMKYFKEDMKVKIEDIKDNKKK